MECLKLLMDLKNIVEQVLVYEGIQIWTIAGSLTRVTDQIDAILLNELLDSQCGDYWQFLLGLRWLNPSKARLIETISRSNFQCKRNSRVWVEESLKNFDIHQPLKLLIFEQSHVLQYYKEEAFLVEPSLTDVLLNCLKALDTRDPSVLAGISLSINQVSNVRHIRAISLPASLSDSKFKFNIESSPPLFWNPIPGDSSRRNPSVGALHSAQPPTSNLVTNSVSKSHSGFHQPAHGESLLSFLSSQDFNTCAQLDRENAHFSFCEALIGAIEQMKCDHRIKEVNDDEDESDEEIINLKQRIRIRRREVELERVVKSSNDVDDEELECSGSSSAKSAESLSSSNSASDCSLPPGYEEDANYKDLKPSTEISNLQCLSSSGLSLSMASMYSDADLCKSNEKLTTDESFETSSCLSAESVALSLLVKFSERQLPKASELEWLVSEKEVPQALLPLPHALPISPDEQFSSTRLRGNLEWAPPRQQIIFTVHPKLSRKMVLERQSMRCAGCGARVETGFSKRYMYCEYLGKYFCPRCHSHHKAIIPARILHRWQFAKFYVSNFSYGLLKKIHKEPWFSILDINPQLYNKERALVEMRNARTQLCHLTSFLKTCRAGEPLLQATQGLPSYFLEDVHKYSIADLMQIKDNSLCKSFKVLVNDFIKHVMSCDMCQAKGFICEICNAVQVIFPFQLEAVRQCPECHACFHIKCFKPKSCPKCARKYVRMSMVDQQKI